jgi:hypothetical protein
MTASLLRALFLGLFLGLRPAGRGAIYLPLVDPPSKQTHRNRLIRCRLPILLLIGAWWLPFRGHPTPAA